MIAVHSLVVGCSPSAGELVSIEVLFSIDTPVMELSHTAVQLGTLESDELTEQLELAEAESMTGLRHTPDEGMAAFAFVVTACTVDETTLIVTEDEITMEFTEDGSIDCAAPAAFLVTHEIAEDAVPDTAAVTDATRVGVS